MDNINESLPQKDHSNLSESTFRFSGKLLLRKEIPLDEIIFKQYLSKNYFTPITSILRKRFYNQCQRCGNRKPSLLATIPCSICEKSHLYCRKCIEMGRVMECEALYYWSGVQADWPKHHQPCSWNGELTAAQQNAANRIINAIKTHQEALLIWAVCGAGKTEMLFPGISEALTQGKRVCIASPRADVVRELFPRIQQAFSDVHVQSLYGGSKEKDGTAQIIIATTHQLLRYKEAFDLLIIDEIDAFPFHQDDTLPFAASRAKKNKSTMIYLTATPRKNHRLLIARKKLPHVFVPLRFHGHPLPVPILKTSFSLKKDLNKQLIPETFIKWLKNRENPMRQLLIFVPTIKLAEDMRDGFASLLFEEKLINKMTAIQSVHAKDTEREQKVQSFRDKDIIALLTTTILERGVTFPSVDVAVLDAGHDVFDEAALVQIAGRAGRSPEDPTGEVIFFHEGKTDAIVQAVLSIKEMNSRGRRC